MVGLKGWQRNSNMFWDSSCSVCTTFLRIQTNASTATPASPLSATGFPTAPTELLKCICCAPLPTSTTSFGKHESGPSFPQAKLASGRNAVIHLPGVCDVDAHFGLDKETLGRHFEKHFWRKCGQAGHGTRLLLCPAGCLVSLLIGLPKNNNNIIAYSSFTCSLFLIPYYIFKSVKICQAQMYVASFYQEPRWASTQKALHSGFPRIFGPAELIVLQVSPCNMEAGNSDGLPGRCPGLWDQVGFCVPRTWANKVWASSFRSRVVGSRGFSPLL